MTARTITARPTAGASSQARNTPPRQRHSARVARPSAAANRKKPKVSARADMNRSAYSTSAPVCNCGSNQCHARGVGAVGEVVRWTERRRSLESEANHAFVGVGGEEWSLKLAGGSAQFFVGRENHHLGPGPGARESGVVPGGEQPFAGRPAHHHVGEVRAGNFGCYKTPLRAIVRRKTGVQGAFGAG